MADKSQLAVAFLKSQPEAAAQILERQDPAAVAAFLTSIPAVRSGPVLARMLPRYSARLCDRVTPEQGAALLSVLSTGGMADILRHARPETLKRVMPHLPERTRLTLRIVLGYAAETVGAWMIPDALVLPRDCGVAEGLARIAEDAGDAEHELIPVVNREGQLEGEVTLRALLKAPDDMSISGAMRECAHTLRSGISLKSAMRHRGWQTHATLPVVNREGKLRGVIRQVDLQRGLATVEATPEPVRDAGILGQIFKAYALSFVALTHTLFASDQR